MRNFYQILGVTRGATTEEIKRAYKALAKKCHPDTAPNSSGSTEAFREITEAYETLGIAKSRAEYDCKIPRCESQNIGQDKGQDSGQDDGQDSGQGNGPGKGQDDHRGNRQNHRPDPHSGGREGATPLSKEEPAFGGAWRPAGQLATVRVPLRLALGGGEVHVTGLPGGMYVVSVPPGTAPGSTATVNTPEGLFKIRLIVEDEPPFFLEGDSIMTTVRLNLAEAVLGSAKELADPSGRKFILEIPPGTQHGAVHKMPLKGLGKGDLVIRLEVGIPAFLSDEERSLFIRFAKKAGLKFEKT